MNVVYVAGPFRGPNHFAIAENIRNAERLALEVWKLGAAAICPHLNTAHFQDAAPDHVWLDGDLELLRRCDAVLVTPDWQRSTGAKAEVAFALLHHIPVFEHLEQLKEWLAQQAKHGTLVSENPETSSGQTAPAAPAPHTDHQ